jgi:hypothetical protein
MKRPKKALPLHVLAVPGLRHRLSVPRLYEPSQEVIDDKRRAKKERLNALKRRIRRMVENHDLTVREVFGRDFDDDDDLE